MSMIFEMIVVTNGELEKLLTNPDDVSTLIDDVHESKRFSLEKTWHGLQFLLTGTAWGGAPPLNFIVGGEAIEGVDMGYGPAKAFRSSQVKELSVALEQLSADDLRRRFDVRTMMSLEIYPTIWDRDPKDDDTLGWLLSSFEELKSFVGNAAQGGHGLVTYMS